MTGNTCEIPNHPPSIGRLRGLLQQQQQLGEAGLARAVGAEEDRDRRELNVARVTPGLEVLDA
jgi:hypothetical protein